MLIGPAISPVARRCRGGAAWTPAEVSSLFAWYEGGVSNLTDAGAGKCSAITDEAGGIGTLTQGTDANRPTIADPLRNGRPGLTGNDAHGLVKSTDMAGANTGQIHCFFVGLLDSANSRHTGFRWDLQAADGFNFQDWSDSFFWDFGGFGAARVTGAIPDGWDDAWHVWEFIKETDGDRSLLMDTVSVGGEANGSNDVSLTSKVFGLMAQDAAGTNGMTGEFGALLIFSEVLTGDDLANVRNYLSENWNLGL